VWTKPDEKLMVALSILFMEYHLMSLLLDIGRPACKFWGWGLSGAAPAGSAAIPGQNAEHGKAFEIWGSYEIEFELKNAQKLGIGSPAVGEMVLHPSGTGLFFFIIGMKPIRGKLFNIRPREWKHRDKGSIPRYVRANYSIGIEEGLGHRLEGQVKWAVSPGFDEHHSQLEGLYSYADGRRYWCWRGRQKAKQNGKSVGLALSEMRQSFKELDEGLSIQHDGAIKWGGGTLETLQSDSDLYKSFADEYGESLPPFYRDPNGDWRFFDEKCGWNMSSTAGDLVEVLVASSKTAQGQKFLDQIIEEESPRGLVTTNSTIHDVLQEYQKRLTGTSSHVSETIESNVLKDIDDPEVREGVAIQMLDKPL